VLNTSFLSFRMQNPICLTLFVCIIFLLIVLVIKYIIEISARYENFYFYSKRNERIRIYQSDEIFDPDELPEYEDYDPDTDPMKFDPDQQPYLDDEEIAPIRKKN